MNPVQESWHIYASPFFVLHVAKAERAQRPRRSTFSYDFSRYVTRGPSKQLKYEDCRGDVLSKHSCWPGDQESASVESLEFHLKAWYTPQCYNFKIKSERLDLGRTCWRSKAL
jgi:hypothetical protein